MSPVVLQCFKCEMLLWAKNINDRSCLCGKRLGLDIATIFLRLCHLTMLHQLHCVSAVSEMILTSRIPERDWKWPLKRTRTHRPQLRFEHATSGVHVRLLTLGLWPRSSWTTAAWTRDVGVGKYRSSDCSALIVRAKLTWPAASIKLHEPS
jgi:hypothetical protein